MGAKKLDQQKVLERRRLIFERSLERRISMRAATEEIDREAAMARLQATLERAAERRLRVTELRRTPIVPPADPADDQGFYWQKGQYL